MPTLNLYPHEGQGTKQCRRSWRQITGKFRRLNPLAADIIVFRKVPLTITVTDTDGQFLSPARAPICALYTERHTATRSSSCGLRATRFCTAASALRMGSPLTLQGEQVGGAGQPTFFVWRT